MFAKYENILLKTSLFHGFQSEEILTMLDCLQPKLQGYNRNDYIVIAGQPFENIGIVLNGEATVSKENAAGNRVVMTLLEQGDIFGEMVAFSSQLTWPATVQAQKNCEVFFLPRGKIIGECSKLCPWHRTLIRNFLRIISERALLLNKKVEYLTIKSIRGKICTYLLEQYQTTGDKHITLPLKRNELADFLNVSRPSLSREICKMKAEGVIDFYLTSFKILDIEALKIMSTL
jgi:CRP-like cAMP-binding protein